MRCPFEIAVSSRLNSTRILGRQQHKESNTSNTHTQTQGPRPGRGHRKVDREKQKNILFSSPTPLERSERERKKGEVSESDKIKKEGKTKRRVYSKENDLFSLSQFGIVAFIHNPR